MSVSEIIGLFAGSVELLGLWLVGSKNRKGFLLSIGGNIFWIAFSLITQTAFGLIIVCSAALFLNIRAYNNWRKSEQR